MPRRQALAASDAQVPAAASRWRRFVERGGEWNASGRTKALTCLAAMAFLVALEHVVSLLWLHQPYWRLYVKYGSEIGLIVAILGAGAESEEELAGRVSASPSSYLSASFAWTGSFLAAAFNTTGGRKRPLPAGVRTWPLDGFVSGLLILPVWLLLWAWLLLVAPIQYFVTLVAGAPARRALATRPDMVAREESPTPSGGVKTRALSLGFDRAPFATTQAFAAALLFVLDKTL